MTDVERLLQRQAAWQKSRTALTWPEKIRIAEQMRDSLRHWRIRSKSSEVTQPAEAAAAGEKPPKAS